MVSRIFLRKLIRDLWSRKGSLIALIAIMTVGVGVYIGMAAVYRDLDGSRRRFYSECRLADFIIQLKRAPRWSVQEVAAQANVREARGRIQQAVLIDLPGREEPISGTAISMPLHRTPVLNNILLRSGTWFTGKDNREVIVDQAFAREHGLVPGRRIRVLLIDKQHDLLVVGTALSPEFVYLIPPSGGLTPDPKNYGVLYLPDEFLQESSDLRGAVNEIIGAAHDASPVMLDDTLQRLHDKLDPYGVLQATASRNQASVRFLADELQGLKVTVRIMPTIFLVVAALVLNILMGRLVAQQRPVIGTLKALGYSTRSLLLHYLSYGLFIGAAGGICGILLGYWLQKVYVQLYRSFFALPEINPHFYPGILLSGLEIGIFFALLGTLKGVRYSASLEPADAMRPPAPEKGGKVLPERIPILWKRLPFSWKMILRAVFRNPFRSAVCIFTSLISTAIIIMALCNMDSLHYLMDYEFNRISHQDMTVSLRDPKGIRVLSEFRTFPSLSQTEPQLTVACDLSNGPYQKRTGIIALPENNSLYTPLNANGNPITIPQTGLILTKKLAEVLHVKQGDFLRLRPLIARREEKLAPVEGIVDSFLGLSAYADIRYISRLLGEEWVANVMLDTTFHKGGDPSLLKELQRRPAVVAINERLRTLEQMNETFGDTMNVMISIMVLFSGLIAFGSVLNAALVSLSERQREVGTLRVLGYSVKQVSRIFSGESYFLNAIGTFLGLFAGIGLAHLLTLAYSTELYRFPAVIHLARLVQTILIMAGFVWLAQWIVYRMIARLKWLEVLQVKE